MFLRRKGYKVLRQGEQHLLKFSYKHSEGTLFDTRELIWYARSIGFR